MDREYQRLLDRDHSPITFLYNGFRRNWGTYESIYLYAKLSTLMLITLINPDNCVLRSLPREPLPIARDIVLLIVMVCFFIVQCISSPCIDPVNNASEWTSRLNYVLTSAVALAVAVYPAGETILDGPILYIIYIITYGLSICGSGFTTMNICLLTRPPDFTIINTGVMQRFVKRTYRHYEHIIVGNDLMYRLLKTN